MVGERMTKKKIKDTANLEKVCRDFVKKYNLSYLDISFVSDCFSVIGDTGSYRKLDYTTFSEEENQKYLE